MAEKEIRYVIAGNISGLRKKQGWTQADLATRLSYSDKAVSKWERGESLPDAETLYRLANLFNVEVSYLFEEHEYHPLSLEEEKRLKRREGLFRVVFVIAFVLVILILGGIVLSSIAAFLEIPSTPLYSILFSIAGLSLLFLIGDWVSGIKRYMRVGFSVLVWSLTLALYFVLEQYEVGSLIISMGILIQISILGFPYLFRLLHDRIYKDKK